MRQRFQFFPLLQALAVWPAAGWLAFVVLAAAAEAEPKSMQFTGADFLTVFSRHDPEWAGFCNGYVQAIFDGVRKPGEFICLPAGTARSMIVEEVLRHVKTSPGLQNLNAASLVYAIMLKTYPCP